MSFGLTWVLVESYLHKKIIDITYLGIQRHTLVYFLAIVHHVTGKSADYSWVCITFSHFTGAIAKHTIKVMPHIQ